MAKERDLKFGEYQISENRYRELKYFCRQYKEKKEKLRAISEVEPPIYGSVKNRNTETKDPTFDIAIKRMELQEDLDMIDESAKQADFEIYKDILANVTDGIPIQHLNAPCSASTFKRRRRDFYIILDKKKR